MSEGLITSISSPVYLGLRGEIPVSEVSSYSIAIFHICFAVVAMQIVFFAQDLTMEQPRACTNINQRYPI
jgi:hypothetical protein